MPLTLGCIYTATHLLPADRFFSRAPWCSHRLALLCGQGSRRCSFRPCPPALSFFQIFRHYFQCPEPSRQLVIGLFPVAHQTKEARSLTTDPLHHDPPHPHLDSQRSAGRASRLSDDVGLYSAYVYVSREQPRRIRGGGSSFPSLPPQVSPLLPHHRAEAVADSASASRMLALSATAAICSAL